MTVVRSQNQSEDRYQAFRDAVTKDLTARIKDGQAPWLMPVDPGSPRPDAFNAETGRLYRGMNALLMDSAGFSDPRWLSYARAQTVGAQVRGGEKGVRIEYWKQEEEQDRANRDGTLRPPVAFTGQPTIRYDRPDGPFVVTVFNADQMDGMPPPALSPALDPCSEAERLVATSGIRILHDQRDRGFYKPDTDTIHMPGPDAFRSMEAFHAATLGHIIAATGHRSRLDRDAGGGSGPERQAHEALVNALASFTVTTRLGLGHDPSPHRHYVNNWLERIEKDPSFLFRATAEAAQASDWVRAPEYRQTLEQEVRSMKTHDPVVITPPAPEAERTRLYVPFSEKDAAKAAGARWDKEQKFWYVTGQPGEEFSAWLTPPPRDRATGQETTPAPAPEKAFTWLDVPEGAKTEQELTGLGARFDATERAWYVSGDVHPDLAPYRSVPDPDPAASFTAFCKQHDLDLDGPPRMDGQWHHIGDAAYRFRVDGRPRGEFRGKDIWDQHSYTVRWNSPPGTRITDRDPAMLEANSAVPPTVSPPSEPDKAVTWLDLKPGSLGEEIVLDFPEARPDPREDAWYVSGDVPPDLAPYRSVPDPDPAASFTAFCKQHGLDLDGPPRMDGQWHQIGDAAYRFRPDGRPRGQLRHNDSSKPHTWIAAPGTRIPERDITWLELDPSDHEAARRAGAWWDRDKKAWYTVGESGQERKQSHDVPITRLHVPFSEKDAAKAAGARWDKEQKFWYVTGQPGEEFSAWLTPPPRQPEQDPVEAFTHACRDNGLVLDGPALMDGKWHRVRVADDRAGEKSGSYRGFLDGVPAGAIMNYRLGSEAVKWVASPDRIQPQDMAAQIAHSRQMREKRDLELLERQERVAGLAETTWKEATGPVVNHDWLARKKVSPDLARMNQAGQVVVPACDMQGRVWNVQTIDPDGRKSFMKEGRVSGLMYVLPGKDGSKGPTILAEGFSTAATVHELTGNTVVVAFNAGNLPKVARTLRAANPDLDLLVAADDDHARTVNAGRQAAAAAARESGARMLLPPLTDAEKARGLTDWNDLRVARGAAKTREALDKAGLLATVRPAREQKQGRSQSTTAMALQ